MSMLANRHPAAPLLSCFRSVNSPLKSKTVVRNISDNKTEPVQGFSVHEA